LKKILINNQIRASQVRLVDETGKNLGVVSLDEALKIAKERNLDLIQVTEKIDPPVCKLGDYGKYIYSLQKKERGEKSKKIGEVKTLRLGVSISTHDLETKAHLAEKFLNKGNKVKIELMLKGREEAFPLLAKEKIKQFLEIIEKTIPIKVENELKKVGRNFIIIISKK
jgi:translation initiation factor IF-3